MNEFNQVAYDRLRYLFDIDYVRNPSNLVDMKRYGLGTYRTREQWESKLGINLKSKFISDTVKTNILLIVENCTSLYAIIKLSAIYSN